MIGSCPGAPPPPPDRDNVPILFRGSPGMAAAVLVTPDSAHAAPRVAVGEAAVPDPVVATRLPAALRSADAHRLGHAMRLIDECWRDRPTIDGLARACGLNRDKLTSGFRALFRCSVAEAIAARRLGHAEALLATTDLAVGQVGYRSGYRSEASFCRAFRRRFGLAPAAFRRARAAA